ncbi:hypothetical protein F5146DRAFT_483965 [Armillaria mellea]|nr:hypothetical protein F5146DRAFT_483965 [Armillaria mellea]
MSSLYPSKGQSAVFLRLLLLVLPASNGEIPAITQLAKFSRYEQEILVKRHTSARLLYRPAMRKLRLDLFIHQIIFPGSGPPGGRAITSGASDMKSADKLYIHRPTVSERPMNRE